MPDSDALTETQGRQLVQLAYAALKAAVGRLDTPVPADEAFLNDPRGVFVTLESAGKLRGCIGFPIPSQPLGRAVIDAAEAAALRDPRFDPVAESELAAIELEVSVLTPPRPVEDIEQIEIGRHGLIMKQANRSGLLLPQVASERDWDRLTFLKQTCLKAGLKANAWQEGASIESFEAQIFS